MPPSRPPGPPHDGAGRRPDETGASRADPLPPRGGVVAPRLERAIPVGAALTVLGYIVSRTIGLPQITNHVGHWADPWGTASLVVEAALILLAARARLAVVRLPRIRVGTWRGVHMSRPR